VYLFKLAAAAGPSRGRGRAEPRRADSDVKAGK
jgi:hypothetical protein